MASYVDLLIVGAGPAGLMMALWASQYNINARIIDKKSSRVRTGQADGLHARTIEILHSFGLSDRFMKSSYHVNEICSWNPSPDDPDKIQRTQRAASQPKHLSRFPQQGLSQGLTEQILLDYLDLKGKVHVERNTTVEDLQVNDRERDDDDAFPITLTLRKLADADEAANGSSSERDQHGREAVKAKYVVGCDGAHSWVRRQLGIPMEGERTNRHFGVMDIVPLTDFPDIRESCVIHSSSGSVMTIPRENRLVRLYVQLDVNQDTESHRFDTAAVTPEMILVDAKNILHPYELDFRICDWSSVYTVGQRVAPRFTHRERVFLSGDAVHTHSPTMGQGMNVSMQDAYNLGWKICSVLTGTSSRDILRTYNDERRPIALELIELDKKMSRFYSDGPSSESQEYQKFRDSFAEFLSGMAVQYHPSSLVANAPHANGLTNGDMATVNGDHGKVHSEQSLAKRITVGRRLPSYKVLCQAEANVVHMADLLPSNGRWRVLVFAGNLASSPQLQTVQDLGIELDKILRLHTPSGQDIHSVIEILTLHSGTRDTIDMLKLHEIYHPWDESLGWDYWKVLSDDASTFEPCESAYDQYGVNKQAGCVAVLRPDQHVSYVGHVDDYDAISRFFSHALLPAQKR